MQYMKEAPVRTEPQAVFFLVKNGRVEMVRGPRSQFSEMLRAFYGRPQTAVRQ